MIAMVFGLAPRWFEGWDETQWNQYWVWNPAGGPD